MGITAWVSVIVSTRHAGLRLESTLADLRAVHGYAEQRRLLAEGSLSEPAVALLGRLSRPATTEEKVLLAYETATGRRAISRIEKEQATQVRPDLLGVEEFGFTPKTGS